jgi:hypothetical protein
MHHLAQAEQSLHMPAQVQLQSLLYRIHGVASGLHSLLPDFDHPAGSLPGGGASLVVNGQVGPVNLSPPHAGQAASSGPSCTHPELRDRASACEQGWPCNRELARCMTINMQWVDKMVLHVSVKKGSPTHTRKLEGCFLHAQYGARAVGSAADREAVARALLAALHAGTADDPEVLQLLLGVRVACSFLPLICLGAACSLSSTSPCLLLYCRIAETAA